MKEHNLKSSCHLCSRKGAPTPPQQEGRGLIIRHAKSNTQVIGLRKASRVPGIIGEPTGEQGESSEKEEAWKLWDSKVMVMPLDIPDTSICKTFSFLCYTHLTDENGGLEATH